jgi:hypothetical protein
MKGARAAAVRNAEPTGVQRRSPARRRSGGDESKGAMAVEGTRGSGIRARGAREEVAWNGYNNTEEGPALFYGRQPGRAAPDEMN